MTIGSIQPHEAEAQARDRMVDGLLRTQHETPLERERRVAATMRAVRHDAAAAHPLRRLVRAAGGLAAVAAVMVAAVIFTPREVNAADRARTTVQRERAGDDRRVMFILNPPAAHAERPSLTGTLDVRDARHMVLTVRMPDGREEIHGLNGDSAWAIGLDGSSRVEPSDHPWPVWIRSPRGGLLVDIAETIESGLSPGWSWSVSKPAGAEAGTEQLVAARERGPRAEPNRISATIDSLTGRVKRLEIEWPKGGAPAPFEQREERAGDRPLPPPDGMRGHRPPMGAPSSMVIIPEPPVTFPDDWFTAASHQAKP